MNVVGPATRVGKLGIGAFVIAGLTSLSTPAAADAYDATLARAIAAKERALDTNDPASWEDALTLFQQADRLRSTKETKYELGSAAARLRQDDLAVEAFESAIALGLEGGAHDKARAFLQDKSSQMARLEVVGPDGAELYVGSRQRGTLPLGRPLVVFAGKTRLRLVSGEREATLEVATSAGGERRVDFMPSFAAPDAPPPAPNAGPPPPKPPPREPVTVQPPSDPSQLGWTLAIAGGATALIGTGLVIGASATIATRRDRPAELCAVSGGQDECTNAQPGKREAAQSEVDAIATWKAARIGGWIGLGAGLAAATTGIVILAGSSNDERSARWLVVPTRGGAAIAVTGAL